MIQVGRPNKLARPGRVVPVGPIGAYRTFAAVVRVVHPEWLKDPLRDEFLIAHFGDRLDAEPEQEVA